MFSSYAAHAALLGLLGLRLIGLGPHVQAPSPDGLSSNQVAELWVDPGNISERDLVYGAWGADTAPNPEETYTFVSQKKTGFSPGYDVKDSRGTEWSVKLGPEAQTEVVASRILWAMGYHQPPVYYLPRWPLEGGPSPGIQNAARFRPKGKGLDAKDPWSWQRNPFTGTQPYRGLIVLMVMLNSTDLRNSNNVVYKLRDEREGSDRWYVVRDLGASFGETGIYRPRRNYLEGFEREPFILGVQNDRVALAYRGLHRELTDQISSVDVRWMCELLGQLSAEQWQDAFRAGGYTDDIAERYIAVLQDRIRIGNTLSGTTVGSESGVVKTNRVRRVVERVSRPLRRHPSPD